METVKQSIVLNTSKHQAWQVLADFGNAHKYFKGIVNSYLTSETESGIGTIRHCDLPSMMGMKQFIDEEISIDGTGHVLEDHPLESGIGGRGHVGKEPEVQCAVRNVQAGMIRETRRPFE